MPCLYHVKQSKVLLKWSRDSGEHARRERVYRLLLKNLSPRDISEALGVSLALVERDVDAIQNHLERWLRNHPDMLKEKVGLLVNQIDSLDNIVREAWLQYHRLPDGSGAKVKALDLIRQVLQDTARLQGLLQTSVVAMEVKESQLDRLIRVVMANSDAPAISEAQTDGGAVRALPQVGSGEESTAERVVVRSVIVRDAEPSSSEPSKSQ